jgi:DNA polymerase-3 subunit gamma/tau
MAAQCPPDFLVSALQLSNVFDVSFRQSPNQRLHVELLLIRLCGLNQEKKKSDSLDFISDNPYEVYTAPKVQPNTAPASRPVMQSVQVPTTEQPAATRRPMPKTTSLKGIMSGNYQAPQKEADKVSEASNIKTEHTSITENKPFTENDLISTWSSYAEIIKTEKPGQFSLMQNYSPILVESNKVLVKFEGQIQVDLFQEIKLDLLMYLKKTLRNLAIDITEEIEVTEGPQKNRLFTSDDKLKFLIEQNPALLRMKQQLNLDFS